MNIAIILFLASLVMLTIVAAINLWLLLANRRRKKRIDKDKSNNQDKNKVVEANNGQERKYKNKTKKSWWHFWNRNR